ncbi:PREDICTED: ankyrin repeat and BTB/POZ domain-containing protein 2-like [Acropora digitifera]|uniref:ankyrin repeat and BTB/POZ domain-containing protein 2-like n=1 Tax=Acropora digitifera TaxID=70779 RepID=UPI00077B1300|nr:PREDICTED: ankyrin repeat and BTB/POZ domain-containing protein 2-like [Acropora digitifera]
MAQADLPANSHFLSLAASTENHVSPRNEGQLMVIDTDWDEWLPMLPSIDDLPWSLKDIAKVLRLGRTREKFRAITPQAVERVSFLLQRPLLRIVREAKRLSFLYSKCSKQEMQTSIRLVLSLSLAKSCLSLASKALSLYQTSNDRFHRSKRARCGLILPVGKMFRWLVNLKVATRIHDAGVIYLSACLEFIAEELVYRAVTKQGEILKVTPEVLEEWISTDADFWGIFQPYYHLLSGRTAFGVTDSIDVYAVPKKVSRNPKTGSPRQRGLDKSLAITCVSSLNELTDLISQAQRQFIDVYQSKDNKFISQVDWSPSALNSLFYFIKCADPTDENGPDILAGTRRSHSDLPPLVEWLKASSLHTEHRASGMVDDDDVRQAARLMLPFHDCGPRSLSSSVLLCLSKALSSAVTISSFQQDLCLRMLSCGRADIIPRALEVLGPEKINAINVQGMTMLMYACADGNEDLVRTLLEHGVLVDTQVPNNQQIYPLLNLEFKSWTALCFAATKEHVNICQLLLDNGASPNGAIGYGPENQVDTPLQLASATGNLELVSLLLRNGADPDQSVNVTSFSPVSRGFGNALAAATAHGHKDVLRMLFSEPDVRRDAEMLSLAEILSEGELINFFICSLPIQWSFPDLALSKELAFVLSSCFGSEPLQEIVDLPVSETSIRIGSDYINSADMSDVTFLVEGRPFYAHKIILATASKKFKALLSEMPSESEDGNDPCIEISDIKYDIFTLVIQFLYSGRMEKPSEESAILEILKASEFFMLESLKRRCECLAADYLDCDNVLDTYTFAKLCKAKELVSFCEAFMLRNLTSMMEIMNFRDALVNNNKRDLFASLKSCLIQRIYARNVSRTSLKV